MLAAGLRRFDAEQRLWLGPIGNIAVGIVGAVIAGWLLPHTGFVLVGGILDAFLNAIIGAVILLLATRCCRALARIARASPNGSLIVDVHEGR